MMIRLIQCLLLCFFVFDAYCQQADALWSYSDEDGSFEWNISADKARVKGADQSTVWEGSLLPAFWISTGGSQRFVKAVLQPGGLVTTETQTFLSLQLDTLGKGRLSISKQPWGISFDALQIEWRGSPPAIIEMYFGVSLLDQSKATVAPTWERPFMPDWTSFGFCVPGAKGGTPQSYFRMWDFGHANIALGSFGPSMGSPYAAAFPRPLYYAAMGSNSGFIAMGAGTIPDGAMSLRIQSTRGCLQYIYREDLWGAPAGNTRSWESPLRLTTGANPWQAFRKYYSSFPAKTSTTVNANKVIYNTWGMWGKKKYIVRPIVDFAAALKSEMFVLDDPWEKSQGAGEPNLERFPDFYKDFDYIRNKGMKPGIWETVGWISDPYSKGLTNEDLICNAAGIPCKASWNFDPWNESYYCLDISSEKAREFIKQRTTRIMKTIKPSLIKLDFGYGFPSPHMGSPRNPSYRGERYVMEIMDIIVRAAKTIDPQVAFMYYGLSPLFFPVTDLVSMDDQGDLWYDVARGHQEWSIWAALLSDKNMPIHGSSSYDWETDDEVLLNTCIIGQPGSVLPIYDLKDGTAIPSKFVNRRLAVHSLRRKTINWTPVWLNSQLGDFDHPPQLYCWGRSEKTGGDSVITSLVLRKGNDTSPADPILKNIEWEGRWAVIAQDDRSVFSSSRLAIIPFDEGRLSFPCAKKPERVTVLNIRGEQPSNNWTWSGGRLHILLTAADLEKTGGFVAYW